MDPWELESIDYNQISNLNDYYHFKIILDHMDNIFFDMKNKLINYIATRKTANNIDLVQADDLNRELLNLLEQYRSEYKKKISILSHISDIEGKTNVKTANIFYDNLQVFITNELYKAYGLLIRYLDERF
jgi:hypothetical protein